MAERLLFLTGHLARPRLEKVLRGLGATPFTWEICDIGVKVAALMTQAIIARRLPRPLACDRVIVPGRCRADLDALALEFSAPFARGPDELSGSGLTQERHRYEVSQALGEAKAFRERWRNGDVPAPVAAVHLREAVRSLEDLVGPVEVEDILDEVFRRFCVGK